MPDRDAVRPIPDALLDAARGITLRDPRIPRLAHAKAVLDDQPALDLDSAVGRLMYDGRRQHSRDWLRAAVAAGLIPADPESDRDAALRQRYAEALRDLRITLGRNTLAQAAEGKPIPLSGGERDAAALLVLAVDREEIAALRQQVARVEARLANAKKARSRLFAALIASAHLLDLPFSNAPELSPWTRSIKPAMTALRAALDQPEAHDAAG